MSAPFACALSSYGVLAVTGPEASKLLQGQVTCDVHQVSETQLLLGACCTNQGRILALFYLTGQAEWLQLILPRSLLPKLSQHLNKFAPLYRGKAVVQDVSAQYHLYGSYQRALTSEGKRFALDPERQLYCLESPLPNDSSVLVDEAAWQLQQIRHGEAMIDQATSGELLPQQINLAQIGGISFSKGCYTGQEIIARMHYRGQLKRHLYLFQLPLAAQANAGDPVFAFTEQHEQKVVGTLVNSQCYQQQHLALIECLDQYRHHCQLKDGSRLGVLELPYSLNLAE